MTFKDYIKGQRKGKGANLIERDSMTDPFLADAIDGFDSVDDDHQARIASIRSALSKKQGGKADLRSKRHFLNTAWRAAAVIAVLIFALGGYLLIDNNKTNLYARENDEIIIDIFVPESYFVQNEILIEENNVVLATIYKPTIENFRVNEVLNTTISKDEFEALKKELMKNDEGPLDIYSVEEDNIPVSASPSGKPEPTIGWDRYKSYLQLAKKRPTDDACYDVHGKVAVDFFIDESGKPYDLEIPYQLCGTSDEEAMRLVKEGPKWTTGKEKVRVVVEF